MNDRRFYANYGMGHGRLISADGVEFAPAVFEKIAAQCVADLVSKGWTEGSVQAEIDCGKITVTAYSREIQPNTYGDSAAYSTFCKIGKKRYTRESRQK